MTVDTKKLFNYWQNEADYSWDIAESLFASKKYPESLFFAHLSIEKILKALVVAKTNTSAPQTHNLLKLAQAIKFNLSDKQRSDLDIFSDFCIAGRYDAEKMTFRKKCTAAYTKKYFDEMKSYFVWLKDEVKKTSLTK